MDAHAGMHGSLRAARNVWERMLPAGANAWCATCSTAYPAQPHTHTWVCDAMATELRQHASLTHMVPRRARPQLVSGRHQRLSTHVTHLFAAAPRPQHVSGTYKDLCALHNQRNSHGCGAPSGQLGPSDAEAAASGPLLPMHPPACTKALHLGKGPHTPSPRGDADTTLRALTPSRRAFESLRLGRELLLEQPTGAQTPWGRDSAEIV
eukprot:366337-Chlamydomonas_euryale.AAC.18